MSERARLNFDTDDLDTLARLAEAQREVKEIAHALYHHRTSKRGERQDFARRLNGVASSLRTVELRSAAKENEP